MPYLAASDELKSKPTQHSVKEMLALGIHPDIIVCRTEHPLTDDIRNKIALFCNVEKDCVIENNNCDILYAVPMMLHDEGLDNVAVKNLVWNAASLSFQTGRKCLTLSEIPFAR